MPLTVKRVERLNEPGRYPDEHGLYLQITRGGAKSWLMRWERAVRDAAGEIVRKPNGRAKTRERWMGLGPLHTYDLPAARERAQAARKQLADGLDPLEAKHSERAERAQKAAKRKTFRQAAQAFYDEQNGRWRNDKHRAQFLASLNRYAYPHIGDLAVDAIVTGDVLRVFDAKVDGGEARFWAAKPETAKRVLTRIRAVLDWAAVRGYRSGDNPARWAGHLKHALGPRMATTARHFPALPWREIGTFMMELRQREGLAARALELAILTGARTAEVTGATWVEIDLKAKLWTIPAGRMKNGRAHAVPLSQRAVELLEALPREAEWVFPGMAKGKAISSMAMLQLLRRMGRGDLTTHGFRSSFRDWAAERTTYPQFVAELCLAHTVGSAVERAYLRSDLLDMRRKLLGQWSRFCASPLPTEGEGESSNLHSVGERRAG